MKKPLLILAILMVTTLASQAQIRIGLDVIIGNRAPNPNEARAMRAEEMAHPNIQQAIQNVHDAMIHLQAAPDNFGGHKAQAIADLRTSYISLRRALYYRLYVDTH